MTVILCEGRETETSAIPGNPLWLNREELEAACGWQLKPEGFCKDDICVPLPAGQEEEYLRDDAVNVSSLWLLLGKPAVADPAGETWVLEEGAQTRNDTLLSLQAPDFSLPDFDGNFHSLSNFQRKRVLLLTWASW